MYHSLEQLTESDNKVSIKNSQCPQNKTLLCTTTFRLTGIQPQPNPMLVRRPSSSRPFKRLGGWGPAQFHVVGVSNSRGCYVKVHITRSHQRTTFKEKDLENSHPIWPDGMSRSPQGEAVLQVAWPQAYNSSLHIIYAMVYNKITIQHIMYNTIVSTFLHVQYVCI